MATTPKLRRTQEERTAQTREALVNAAIEVIHQSGYAAASTTAIAEAAGVSRGAILHQFGTRAALMAEVVQAVYRREVEIYAEILSVDSFGHRIYDWPKILLEVLGRPAGVAVLEILIAAQSDSELDQAVRISQADVEAASLHSLQTNLGGDTETALAVKQLMVWAVRGLTLANRIMPGGVDMAASVALLSGLLKMAAPQGRVDELQPILRGPD